MSNFKSALQKELRKSFSNNFGVQNYDEYRFGKMPTDTVVPENPTLFYALKQFCKKIIGRDNTVHLLSGLSKYENGLENLYRNVGSESQALIVKLIAYRLLGFSKVKLPFNTDKYWKSIEVAKSLKVGSEQYDPHFLHFILNKFDLNPIGYDIRLFFSEVAIAIDFVAEQYAYKTGGKTLVQADKGDVVLDVGGCWADTALYFASKIGPEGNVYSFEFIPDNIKLHNINTSFNPDLKKRIELVPNPVSDTSGIPVYYFDHGPGSRIEFTPFEGQTGSTSTISIDDFVTNNNLEKVDFIKMDIEGAEPSALKGAVETIKKFRPKLAIAIYHSMEDFINIPEWILSLNLDYELFIGHYTIHAEETVCFAKPKEK